MAPRQRDFLLAARSHRACAARGCDLDDFAGRVSDSGEGRWTLAAAIDEGVPAPVISAALFSRFQSRGNAGYADRVLSAMRKHSADTRKIRPRTTPSINRPGHCLRQFLGQRRRGAGLRIHAAPPGLGWAIRAPVRWPRPASEAADARRSRAPARSSVSTGSSQACSARLNVPQ